MPVTTGFWNSYVGYISRIRERRAHRQTTDAIADLPPHILRDIGWPGAYERSLKRRGK
jgi:hypothetical protein